MSRKGVAHHCGRCGEPGHHAPRCPHPEGQARIPSASGRAAWREALAALAAGDEPPAAVVAQLRALGAVEGDPPVLSAMGRDARERAACPGCQGPRWTDSDVCLDCWRTRQKATHPAPKRGAQLCHLPTDTSVRGGEHCGRELGHAGACDPDRGALVRPRCESFNRAGDFRCTREDGHAGSHFAGTGKNTWTSWADAGAQGDDDEPARRAEQAEEAALFDRIQAERAPAALEPARAEAPAFKLCPVVHSATRIPCELERGHLGEHRAELHGGVVQAWIGAGATGWRRASAARCDAPSGVEPAGYTCGRDPGHPAEHMAEIDSGKFAVWERPGRRNIYIEEIRRPVPLSSPEVAETLRRASFGALPKFASEPLATPDDAHRRVRHGLDVTPEPRPHVPTESAGADGARAAEVEEYDERECPRCGAPFNASAILCAGCEEDKAGAEERITPKAEALLASIAAGCDRALADLAPFAEELREHARTKADGARIVHLCGAPWPINDTARCHLAIGHAGRHSGVTSSGNTAEWDDAAQRSELDRCRCELRPGRFACTEPAGHAGLHRSEVPWSVAWNDREALYTGPTAPPERCGALPDDWLERAHLTRCERERGHGTDWCSDGTDTWARPDLKQACGAPWPANEAARCTRPPGHPGRHQTVFSSARSPNGARVGWSAKSPAPCKLCRLVGATCPDTVTGPRCGAPRTSDDPTRCQLAAGHEGPHRAHLPSGASAGWGYGPATLPPVEPGASVVLERVSGGLKVSIEPAALPPLPVDPASIAKVTVGGLDVTPRHLALSGADTAARGRSDDGGREVQDKTDHGTGEQDQKRSGTPDTCSPVASTADESSHHGDPGAGEGAEVAAEMSTARRGRPSGRFRRALTARNTVKARRKASARPKKCEEGD